MELVAIKRIRRRSRIFFQNNAAVPLLIIGLSVHIPLRRASYYLTGCIQLVLGILLIHRGLTQEQVANYLGVSTPAVNKWEKGNTYPDISLLPALARLLKIDMNELFSFREELTEKEIGLFVNELSEVSLDSFTKAFEMASRKIQEYPHCDLLIYKIATVLNASLTLSDLNDEERMEYNTAIIEWLERTADSQDERVRNSSHSRSRLPNIRKPTSATLAGATNPASIVTTIGNKILVISPCVASCSQPTSLKL